MPLAASKRAGNGAAPRKTKLAVLGIPSAVLEHGSPEYKRCVRLASQFKKARTKEYLLAHGYVSSGVSALLAASALALSASRFLYEMASGLSFQPEDKGNISMPQVLKLASSLSDSSRQNELSAWELCAREAVVRRRNDANNQEAPWITSVSGGAVTSGNHAPNGAEIKKAGRPRKAVLQLLEENTHARNIGQTEEGGNDSSVTTSSGDRLLQPQDRGDADSTWAAVPSGVSDDSGNATSAAD